MNISRGGDRSYDTYAKPLNWMILKQQANKQIYFLRAHPLFGITQFIVQLALQRTEVEEAEYLRQTAGTGTKAN